MPNRRRITDLTLVVTGGRDYDDAATVNRVLSALSPQPTLVVHGGCTGADQLAAAWARRHVVPSLEIPADWRHRGNLAGPERNHRMVEFAFNLFEQGSRVRVVAFPGGRGTDNCCMWARKYGLALTAVDPDGTLKNERAAQAI